jgi:carnitine 3-dehydrogenase
MSRQKPNETMRVGIIGAGVIGGAWAAHFMRHGMHVKMWDPAPDAEAKFWARLNTTIMPTLLRLGMWAGASADHISFVSTLEEAVADAQFVQENTPERLPIKISTLKAIDAACPPDAIIASSTSGYLMSEMAIACQHPERCVVAHPFNPVYLMPVVEVVAGSKTTDEAHQWAVDFYRYVGKQPLKLTKEVPGFVADRLMEAVWREALHMIDNDMATVEEIDMSVRYGPGLRWAMMGPLTVLHLAGGEGGMAHCIHQFGPSLQAPWTFLEPPELTDELAQKVVDGCERLAEYRPIADLESERDDLLIKQLAILEASSLWHVGNKPAQQIASQKAAQLKADYDADYYLRHAHQRWQQGAMIDAPLTLFACAVDPAWIDYNGHMTESAYLWAFGEASDALFRFIGIDEAYRASGNSFYTVETHINYFREATGDDKLKFTTQILDLDAKRLHLFHSIYDAQNGDLICTTEQMLLHVDSGAAKAVGIRPNVHAALTAIFDAHKSLPKPAYAGRQIGIK